MVVQLADTRHSDAAIRADAERRVSTRKVLAALDAAGYAPCEQRGGKMLKAGYRIQTRRDGPRDAVTLLLDVGVPPLHERHWPESRVGIEIEGYVRALTEAGLQFTIDDSVWAITVTGPITANEIADEEKAIRDEHEVEAVKSARYNVVLAMNQVALPETFRERLDQLRSDMSAYVGQPA